MDNSNYQDGGQTMTDEELRQQLEGLSGDEILEAYVQSLLIEKGFTNLDEETESKMIADLKERAIDMINFSIIDALPDEKAAEIAEKVENGEDAEALMNAAVEEAGIDAQKITGEALDKLRELYLGENKAEE
jgi:RNA-splicing ligase RtcB